MTDFFIKSIESIRESSQLRYPLPAALHSTVNLFKTANIYWWSFKYYQIVKKAEEREKIVEGNPVVYGALIHGISQYSDVADYLLKVALVAKCAEDLLQSYRNLHKAYKEFSQAIHLKYPVYQKQKLIEAKESSSFPSASLFMDVHLKKIKYSEQILKIITCTGQLIQEIFVLSMRLRDVYLLSQQDSLAQYSACVEGMADLNHYWKRISQDSIFLMNQLKKHDKLTKLIVDKIPENTHLPALKTLIGKMTSHLPQNSAQFINAAEEFFEPVFTPGKVTALTLTFNKPKHKATLPARRSPPWRGQKVKQKISKRHTVSGSSPMAKTFSALKDTQKLSKIFTRTFSMFSMFTSKNVD